MKTALVVLAVLTVGFATEARAQYFPCYEACKAVLGTGAVADASIGLAGIVFATGSTVKVAQGRLSRPWFVGSYVFGSLNLILSSFFGYAAGSSGDAALWGIFAAHATVALWNIAMPTIGLIRGERSQAASRLGFAPVVVQGKDAGGQRWAGLGVQLFGF